MSEYQDPTYTEAYSPGASAHGEEVAYGDEGPAYGDHGPYNADAAYSDAGSTYGAEYEQYDQYDPYADPNLLYEEGDDPFPDEAETVVPAAGKAKKPAKKATSGKSSLNAKSIGLAAAGMVLLGSLGLGGYFLFMAPPGEGDPAAASGPSFDLSSLMQMIPFMGSKDTPESIDANQANASAVKQAIEAYAKEHGRLPGTSAAIEAQMEKLGLSLRSPYDAGMMVPIDLGDTPSGPAAIAYAPQGERFTLRVGDSSGKPMKVEGAEWSLMGGPGSASKAAATATKPAPGAKPAPSNQKPSQPSAPANAVAGAAGVGPDDVPPGTPAGPDDLEPPAPGAPGTSGQAAPIAPAAVPAAPVPAPVKPAATPMPPLAVLRKRNQDFDRLRNQGIALLYEKRTSEAMAVFQKALVIKPNDPTVRSWLETIQGVVDKHTFEESQRLRKDRAELLRRARIVAPPPAQVTEPRRRENEAMRLLDELKEDGAPALAPPRLDN